MIIKIRDWFVRMKVYMNRSGTYLGIINSCMILYLTVSNFDSSINLTNWIIPIWFLLLSLIFFFGYLEVKFGFFKAEQTFGIRNNPYMMKIINKLNNIEKELTHLKQQGK